MYHELLNRIKIGDLDFDFQSTYSKSGRDVGHKVIRIRRRSFSKIKNT